MPHSSDEQPTGDRYYQEPTVTDHVLLPPARFEVPFPQTPFSHGLTWSDESGLVMPDLGRLTDHGTREMAMLDLRVILAHLDSAAAAIKAELEAR